MQINFSNGVLNFINCSVPLPTGTGLHVVSPGWWSGKTTIILEIIKNKWEDGILVVVPTINDAEALFARVESWKNGLSCFKCPKIRVIHSDNSRITEMEEYKKIRNLYMILMF